MIHTAEKTQAMKDQNTAPVLPGLFLAVDTFFTDLASFKEELVHFCCNQREDKGNENKKQAQKGGSHSRTYINDDVQHERVRTDI